MVSPGHAGRPSLPGRPAATPRRLLHPAGRAAYSRPGSRTWPGPGRRRPASQRRVAAPKMACTTGSSCRCSRADGRAAARHVLQHLQVQVLDLLDDLAVAAAGLADDPTQRGGQPRLALLGAELAEQVAGNPLARRRARRDLRGHPRQRRRVPAQQDGQQHVILGREIPVQRRDRDARPLRQVLHLQRVLAAGSQHRRGGSEDPVVPAVLRRSRRNGRPCLWHSC